jgi:hypothetical protein
MSYDNSNFIPAQQQSIAPVTVGTLNSNVKVLFMDDLDREEQLLEEQFQALFAEGKAHPDRQRINGNKLGRLLDKHKSLLARGIPQNDRFGEVWSHLQYHFGMNLWSIRTKNTKSAYCDSEKVINRIRDYLFHRNRDEEKKRRGYSKSGKKPILSLDASIGDGDGYTLLDLQATPETVNHDEKLKRAVEEDVNGEFSGTIMGTQPHINAQNSLLLYFQFEDWTKVAKELGADNISSFNSFRTDKIEPLITKNLGLWDLVDLDITGELQRTVMADYPHINAQKVLHLKLRGQRTSYMATRLGVSETKLLTEFINEKCLPLLNRLSN